MPASYFDVDGTILQTSLLSPTLFYMLRQATPWRSVERLAGLLWNSPSLALAEWQDRRLYNQLLFQHYRGLSHDRLYLLADQLVSELWLPAVYPGARDLLARCTALGHEIVLVSGGLDFLLERLAVHLGVSTVIANRLAFRDGYATGELFPPVVAGPEKARLVRSHARARGYDLEDCFAFSDTLSDLPMLSVVGHPVAVNPDGGLLRTARAVGWPVAWGSQDHAEAACPRLSRILPVL